MSFPAVRLGPELNHHSEAVSQQAREAPPPDCNSLRVYRAGLLSWSLHETAENKYLVTEDVRETLRGAPPPPPPALALTSPSNR